MAEYLDIFEYFFEDPTEIVHRIPESGSGETKLGAQLVVRESQSAVFFRDGKGSGRLRSRAGIPSPP